MDGPYIFSQKNIKMQFAHPVHTSDITCSTIYVKTRP